MSLEYWDIHDGRGIEVLMVKELNT